MSDSKGAAIELERILINLIDKVTEGDGEPLTKTEVAYKALAKHAILALLAQEVNKARIDELENWRVFFGANKFLVKEVEDRIKELERLG